LVDDKFVALSGESNDFEGSEEEHYSKVKIQEAVEIVSVAD
jgi:hypothetical protein